MSDVKFLCGFCKTYIDDGIESLNKHREPGGECDQKMAARFELGKESETAAALREKSSE